MNNLAEMRNSEVNSGLIRLGRHLDKTEALYDLHAASNLGIGVVGASGSGKTYTLKALVSSYLRLGATPVILDVHGDYDDIPGVPETMVHTIEYGYTGGAGRINPLHVEANAAGGVYIAMKQFLLIVALFNPSMGSRQKATLGRAVKELYERYGFVLRDERTWTNQPPTLKALRAHLHDILEASNAKIELDVYKELKERKKRLRDDGLSDENKRALINEISDLALSQLTDDDEDDEVASDGCDSKKYRHKWDPKRVEDVMDTISTMIDSGLFGDDSLTLKSGRVNRIVLTALHETDQQALIHLILSRLFNVAYRTFPHNQPKVPRMMVVLDEGKIAKAISRSEMSPINRISTEARKFGMGLMLGVQSSDHMTDDVRRGCGLTIILPVHPTDVANTTRVFQLSQDDLRGLRPRSDALVYMRAGRFLPTHLFAP
jgi:hypothetical protein